MNNQDNKPKCPISFINPVTFIGDTMITDDPELNSLMTLPYDFTRVGSLTRAAIIDETKGNDSIEYKDSLSEFSKNYNLSVASTIYSYAKSNITDLVMNFCIKVASKFYHTDSLNNILLPVDRNTIDNAIDLAGINLSNPIDDIRVITYDSYMDIVMAKIENMVFEPMVIDSVTNVLNSIGLKELYEALFYECFESKPNKIPSVDSCYTFITSCYRELIANESVNLRIAFSHIASNISKMINNIPSYFSYENLIDANYTMDNMLTDNPELNTLNSILPVKEITNEGDS